MDTNPIESKLAEFQLMPWSGQTVHFPAYSFQGQKDPLDAYCFDPNKEQLRLYRDIADPLAELRVGCQLINGYPVIISFDPPSTFLASYKATILSRASTSSITVPSPPGMVYMPFQLAGINFQRAKKNTLFADEMGLGKTIQIIGSFNDILDHQNESLLVICPAYLKLNWKKELERWLVRPMPIHIINAQTKSKPTKFPALPDGGVVIINYDILDRYIDDINRRRFNMVALDECFVAGTPVLTPSGWKPIEVIEVGEFVLSLDFSCGELEWKNVTETFKNPMRGRRLVSIKHSRGEFTCTEEHRVATAGGYKKAIEVTCGENLLSLPSGVFNPDQGSFDGNLLLSGVPQYSQVSAAWGSGGSVDSNVSQEAGKGLLRVLSAVFGPAIQQAKVLWKELLGKMANVTAGGKAQGEQDHRDSPSLKAGGSQSRGFSQNEGQQPMEYAWGAGEDRSITPGAHIPVAWRQRSVDGAAEGSSGGAGAGLGYGARHPNCRINLWRRVLAAMLQGRFGAASLKAGGRGGWGNPQNEAVEILGPQERARPQLSRVDSVEVLERGSGPAPHVYCLEVEGNHNFIAGGAVVSNCHMIKTPEAKRTQAVFALKIPHRLAASGTPAVNRPIELWPIIRFLLGEKKAPPYWDFAKEYCGGKKTPFGLDVRGSSNPVKLRQWMRRTFMIRRLKSEVLKELPPKTRQVIELPAEGEIKMVVDMENSKFAPHEETIGKMMVKLAEAEISEDDDEFHAVSSELAREIKMAIHEISAERVRLSQLKAPLIAAHAKDCLLDPEKKLIIFTYHKEAGRMISDLLGSGKPVDGDMKISDRHAACERFQNDPECRVIVGTIGAMGVGVTLTASSHVIIAELDWRPGIMCQAEDRAHRIGQLGNVLVQYFLFPDSVDSKMIGNLIEKMEVLSQVLDQGGVNESSGAKAKRKKSPVMEFYASRVTPEVQKLVLRGLIELAAMDDRRTQDSKGFSKWDSPIGHRLASKGSLTRQEAAFGLRLIYRYRRQIPDIASALPLAELQK